jgi:hypothetical protein
LKNQKNSEKSLKISKINGFKLLEVLSLNNIGKINNIEGKFESLKNFEKELKILIETLCFEKKNNLIISQFKQI